jgi:NAD(P)-dependent dehydrogenase (short-subunit alcohol dehydrogenase family)
MKKALVTGANVGLGKECARQLASIEGIEKIYLGCRNQEKAEAAKADLETSTGKQIYEVVIIDTSDLPSVRKAVASLEAIDGLVMNAGGGFPLDLTSDGVTQSFAVNVLGHVVLTESLIEAGKLSGSVVYSSSEMVRGVSEMGMQQVKLNDSSVEEFKTVADGNFIKNIKSKDHKMDSYGVIKYMGTLWMSYMARKHYSHSITRSRIALILSHQNGSTFSESSCNFEVKVLEVFRWPAVRPFLVERLGCS